jgi:hypothetical protein
LLPPDFLQDLTVQRIELIYDFLLEEVVVHHLTVGHCMEKRTDRWQDIPAFIAGNMAFVEKNRLAVSVEPLK